MDVLMVTALAGIVCAFGVGYFLGLGEGRGEADKIALKVAHLIELQSRR